MLRKRTGIGFGLAALACLALAAPAGASFHFIKIREVFPGSSANAYGDTYVVLQAYSGGQNHLGGHTLTVYDQTGGNSVDCTFPSGYLADNGASQMTAMVGGVAASVTPDLECVDMSDPIGSAGAACWGTDQITPIDCVAWGNFTGSVGSPVGTPTATVPDGDAVRRSITPGCPTLLQSADDTDDSATDFALATPAPRNNASPITETPCLAPPKPNTTITRTPRNRSRDRTPTWRFTSPAAGATFQCKLDARPFVACVSPFTRRVKPGRHAFKVRASNANGADLTPAVDKFRILRRR